MRGHYFGIGRRDNEMLWNNVHFTEDSCGGNSGGDADHCRDCRHHAQDMANRRVMVSRGREY